MPVIDAKFQYRADSFLFTLRHIQLLIPTPDMKVLQNIIRIIRFIKDKYETWFNCDGKGLRTNNKIYKSINAFLGLKEIAVVPFIARHISLLTRIRFRTLKIYLLFNFI